MSEGNHRQRVNLALNRPAWQENDYSPGWGADKAVDGRYSDRSAGGNQCTISADGKSTAKLRVDLQSVVSISHINIFYRTDNAPSPGTYSMRFAGYFLYVSNTTSKDDGYLCFHQIQDKAGTPTENQTISCPVHGRYVIYYNERGNPDVTYPSYYSQYAFNELCELEAYGCHNPKFYGETCAQPCPEKCQEQNCDISGHCLGCIPGYQDPRCSQTCMPGYYGRDCRYRCSDNCGIPNRCDRFTGECEGECQSGWKGEQCDQKCDGGKYGDNCNQSCGHCLEDEQCDHINGTCVGCSSGYQGSICNYSCIPGFYDRDCRYTCSDNCGVPNRCDRFTGDCDRGCQRGWKGGQCDQKCDGGMYGANCNQNCGHCLDDEHCDHINGTCVAGCSPGYEGSLCDDICSPSYWGIECRENCSTDCINQACHHVSGLCLFNAESLSDKSSDSIFVVVGGVVSAVVILITTIVISLVVFRRCRSRSPKTGNSREINQDNERAREYVYENDLQETGFTNIYENTRLDDTSQSEENTMSRNRRRNDTHDDINIDED